MEADDGVQAEHGDAAPKNAPETNGRRANLNDARAWEQNPAPPADSVNRHGLLPRDIGGGISAITPRIEPAKVSEHRYLSVMLPRRSLNPVGDGRRKWLMPLQKPASDERGRLQRSPAEMIPRSARAALPLSTQGTPAAGGKNRGTPGWKHQRPETNGDRSAG